MKNVIDTVKQRGIFKILIQALRESDLIDTLSVDGPFTIFAPTDKAFSQVPNGLLNDLFNNKEHLTEILTYHIIHRKVMASTLKEISSIPTVNGKNLSIDSRKCMKINDGCVVENDIACSNGIIHVIDAVLLPK